MWKGLLLARMIRTNVGGKKEMTWRELEELVMVTELELCLASLASYGVRLFLENSDATTPPPSKLVSFCPLPPPTCFGSSKTCVIDSCIAALCMSTSQRVYRSYGTTNGHDQHQHINYGMAKAVRAEARDTTCLEPLGMFFFLLYFFSLY